MKDHEKLRYKQMRESVRRSKENIDKMEYGYRDFLSEDKPVMELKDYHKFIDEELAAADYESRKGKFDTAYSILNEAFKDTSYYLRDEDENLRLKYFQATNKRVNRLLRKMRKDKKHMPEWEKEGLIYAISFLRNDLIDRINLIKSYKHGGLEKTVSAIIGFGGIIIGGLLFLSPNITGNVIGNAGVSNFVGGLLFLVGLLGAWSWIRNR